MTNDNNRRDSLILIAFAVSGGLFAWLWAGSILGAFMGWMSGGAAGSAVVSCLNNKRATPYLFAVSAILLATSAIGIGRIDTIWVWISALAGVMLSAIGSQFEKENLDAS